MKAGRKQKAESKGILRFPAEGSLERGNDDAKAGGMKGGATKDRATKGTARKVSAEKGSAMAPQGSAAKGAAGKVKKEPKKTTPAELEEQEFLANHGSEPLGADPWAAHRSAYGGSLSPGCLCVFI